MFHLRKVSIFTQRHPGRDGSAVNPEGHPGQHDHQSSRKVGLQQEEEDVTPQGEVDVQSVVPTWGDKPKSKVLEFKNCNIFFYVIKMYRVLLVDAL